MREEKKIVMEKKTNGRQSSVPSKANGSDTKKDNVLKNGKYGKRRENNNGFFSDNGSYRKPIPQKQKNFGDKRPRSRGYSNQKQVPALEDSAVEVGSAYQVGSKKANFNHLLNFTYAPRDSGVMDCWPQGGRSGRQNRSARVCYNKEQFLQANCQFVVKEDGDYSVHYMDPDVLVKWEAIEQVRVFGHEIPSCPVCLEHPVAAKMTRCGHIYCWACIIHYLALGEKTWRKCPICYEAVHSEDLKSVVAKKTHNYKAGEMISMTLMKKERGSTYAVPKNVWEKRGHFHNIDDAESITQHQKILIALPEQVLNIVADQKQALQMQLIDAEPSEEPFIEAALANLKEKEECLTGVARVKEKTGIVSNLKVLGKDATRQKSSPMKESEPSKPSIIKKIEQYGSDFTDDEEEEDKDEDLYHNKPQDRVGTTLSEFVSTSENVEIEKHDLYEEKPGIQERASESIVPPEYFMIGSPENPHMRPAMEALPEIMPVEEAAEHLELPVEVKQRTGGQKSSDAFYFYQAADGQHLYLHSLNARCLVHEYGSLENCPQTITAVIVEKETVFITEELRKRLRYLNHLPLTCSFEVAELALKPPVLSKETLKHFADDIMKRCILRRKKNREERRWAKHADEEERKRLGLGSRGTIVQSEFVLSGSFVPKSTDDAARSDTSSSSLETSLLSPTGSSCSASEISPFVSVLHKEGEQKTSLSFAQMLKAGKQVTVWPKAVKQEVISVSPVIKPKNPSSDESDSEDRIPVPEFHASFGDAIEAAILNLENSSDDADLPKSQKEEKPSLVKKKGGSSGKTGVTGGKKKKKQTVLFSTSMARGGK
ncbi:hypothetical protein CHS0354_017110 [Potamilus streckersoni]|uniref:E3 ubiquitin-protein ligase RNF10 n=1 Tax=Potamilus streckersoni TaxID=2493646 RepID=A0AAE0SCH8_9BIVA|nr:hypothetical protein CHS0354_017110 [Potamilus streckersoni]